MHKQANTHALLKFVGKLKLFIYSKSFHFFYASSKTGDYYFATKTEIMIIGLITSFEIALIEITNSKKCMKKPIIFPMIRFAVFVLCTLRYCHFSF